MRGPTEYTILDKATGKRSVFIKKSYLQYQTTPNSDWREPTDYQVEFWDGRATYGSFPYRYYNTDTEKWEDTSLSGINPAPISSAFGYSRFEGKITDADILMNASKAAALKNLDGHVMNLAETISDADETLKGMVKGVNALRKSYIAARKGRWKEACRYLGFKNLTSGVANWKLMYQFAVVPLVNDVTDVIALATDGNPLSKFDVKTIHGVTGHHVKCSGRSKVSKRKGYTEDEGDLLLYGRHPTFNRTATGYTKHRLRHMHEEAQAYTRLDYIVHEPFRAFMSRSGVTNPFLIAWNRMPLSFVVDWAFDVSTFLSQASGFSGMVFISGSSSHRSKIEHYITSDSCNGKVATQTRIKRTFLVQHPYFWITQGFGLSVGKVGTLLAMLAK